MEDLENWIIKVLSDEILKPSEEEDFCGGFECPTNFKN